MFKDLTNTVATMKGVIGYSIGQGSFYHPRATLSIQATIFIFGPTHEIFDPSYDRRVSQDIGNKLEAYKYLAPNRLMEGVPRFYVWF